MVNTATEEGSLVSSLHALLESGAGADVTLVVGGSELPAHSFVLALRSPVFAAALWHDKQEARARRIEIADVQEAVLRQLLCFVYTNTAPEMDSMAAEMLSAADKYDVPLLKKRCEEKMARDLTVENAATTAALAELHSCPLLKRRAIPRFLSEEYKKDLMERLFKAARNGSVGEIWTILNAGIPIDVKDDNGDTALHLAVQNSCPASIKFLIGAGADVNVRNSDQQTPLYRSVYTCDIHIMWTLLAASADKDAQDKEGNTPLHLAGEVYGGASKEHLKAVLLAGAKRDIKNNKGCLPYTYNVDPSVNALFITF